MCLKSFLSKSNVIYTFVYRKKREERHGLWGMTSINGAYNALKTYIYSPIEVCIAI